MNRILNRFFSLALFFVAWCAWAQSTVRISILHTNDLHAHLLPGDDGIGGFAYLATEVRLQREGCNACIYLNAGDLVQGTPVSTIYGGTPVYQIANHLGIDAATLGNHEFDYGFARIPSFLRAAHFPIVSANVVNAQGKLMTGRGYVIKEVGGLRMAIIGAVLGDLTGNYATEEKVGPWKILPVVDAVRKTVAEIGNRADLIVVLGHLHDEETDGILHGIPQVAIVIAGHDHKGYKDLRQFEHRYAVQARSYGVELGRLDFEFDRAKKAVVSAEWKRFPIDSHKIAPDPVTQQLIAKWEAKVSKIVDVPIGESRRHFEGADLRKLVEKALAEQSGADIAFINQGNLRGDLPKGRVLARHIWNMLPFDNYVLVGSFKGSELPASVHKEFKIDDQRIYKLAVTDFTASNQASPSELGATGMKFPIKGPGERETMIEWIKRTKTIE